MMVSKKILVAPLNWGLGHATRCIPVIKALQKQGFEVVLASDGAALFLLKKEFPKLQCISLPAYDIQYAANASSFKLKILKQLPKIQRAIKAENKQIQQLVSEKNITGIISDNRLGVRDKRIPSVIITHQINVLSGQTSFFSSKLHQRLLKKFDECWVPDFAGFHNLSGKLGHPKNSRLSLKYIGPLSRMKKIELPIKYDIIAIISGPEPQRTLFEKKVISTLKGIDKKVLLVQGIVEDKRKSRQIQNIEMVNFMDSKSLEEAINRSETVLCRSGYSSIMDLAALEKKAFFVPTPGQFEQLYLAKRLKAQGVVPSCRQNEFTVEKLSEIPLYFGLKLPAEKETTLKDLFGLF